MKERKPFLRYLKATLLLAFLSSLLGSCDMTKQIQLAKENNDAIELGSIVVREGTLRNNIETKGTPSLTSKLRVAVTKREFTKSTASDFGRVTAGTLDSLSFPSAYYELELIDDIGFAMSINEDVASREFVKKSKAAGAITKMDAVIKSPIPTTAYTAVFLEEIADDTMGIVFYNDDERLDAISFSEMVIFDYQVSYFCFGKDLRNRIVVMDLVEEGKRCKKPLVRKATKLTKIKKLVDY